MKNIRVQHLIKSLSNKEIGSLVLFIESSIFNRIFLLTTHKTVSRHKVMQLLKLILKDNDNESINLDDETVFEILFPGEPYDYDKLRIVEHELTKTVEIFLSFLDLIEDPLMLNIRYINQLGKRNLDDILLSSFVSVDKLLAIGKIKDEEYFYKRYLVSHKKWTIHEKEISLRNAEKAFHFLNEEIKDITNCFLTIMMKQLNVIYHFKTHINIETKNKFYTELYNFIKSHNDIIKTNPVLMILSKFLTTYENDENQYNNILELRTLLNKYEAKFNRSDFKNLHNYLFNTCCLYFSNGDRKYEAIVIKLLKDAINKELYVQDGIIHQHNYTSIVSLAIRLNQLTLAKDFIESYKDYLPKKHKENTYLFNYATLQYNLNNYEPALSLLGKVRSKDYFYTTGINNLRLRIYYETNDLESALNLLDSYKHFFYQNKLIPKLYKTRYKNFIRYFANLIKLKLGTSRLIPGMLLLKIEKTPEVEFKQWLMNKISELTRPSKKTNY